MSDGKAQTGGSRFLYESFDAASARLEANERIAKLQFDTMYQRLGRIESLIERLEKRLWLMVYGVVGVILSQGIAALIDTALK